MCVVGIIFWGIVEIKVKFVFRIYDLDKDGYIIEYEMMEILKVNLERERILYSFNVMYLYYNYFNLF